MSTNLDKLYEDARGLNLQPLWVNTSRYTPREPNPTVVAAHWSGGQIVELLRDAGEIASEHADRRVLVCNNPGLPPYSPTTQTMFACVQLLKSGESASMHRHSQSAFRFVMNGEGSHTVLNGQPFHMKRGDFIVTPAWTWHGHKNDSPNEMVWLDGLDSGILRLFDATFFELPFDDEDERDPKREDRFGNGATAWDPHWHFEWATMEAKLDEERHKASDPCFGHRVRYRHPVSGDDPLPTVAAFLNLLPAGFRGETYRSSDSVVFVVVSGEGRTVHDGKTIEWRENDILTIPTWQSYHHETNEDAVLFSFSDRGAQERLKCWREKRG